MMPYYDHAGIVIYHADAKEVLPALESSCFITDPPYGINGGAGGQALARGKGKYLSTGWVDTPEYIRAVCVPIITSLKESCVRGALTPGVLNMFNYPQPDDVGCFWCPASSGISRWGFTCFIPIFYYGKDRRCGIGAWPNGTVLTAARNEAPGHPCPKPLRAWKWLVEKVAAEDDVILDPFMGSGTTLVAAKLGNRKAIGIEIEERYCEIAARRLAQEVFEFGDHNPPLAASCHK